MLDESADPPEACCRPAAAQRPGVRHLHLWIDRSAKRRDGAPPWHDQQFAGEAEALGVAGPELIAATAPLTFDISVWQMFVPLIFGGTVRAVPTIEVARDPERLFQLPRPNSSDPADRTQPAAGRLDEWDHQRPAPVSLALRNLAVTERRCPPRSATAGQAVSPASPLSTAMGRRNA